MSFHTSAALTVAIVGFLFGCTGDTGPDAPQLTTYIHDPYVIANLDEISRCLAGSDPESHFVVFDASVNGVKASTAEELAIPSRFVVIGLYRPEHMDAVPESAEYGLLLDYTGDLQVAMTTPSESILGGFSLEDERALTDSCGFSVSTGTTRLKMGPLGATLVLTADMYCTPPYLGGEACWPKGEVLTFLEEDPWRGPTENFDPF